MVRKTQCTALLSPFQIKHVKVRNRIVKSPQASGNATPEGAPTDGSFAYYEELAKGGTGLIIVEGAGHTASEPGIESALVRAVKEFE